MDAYRTSGACNLVDVVGFCLSSLDFLYYILSYIRPSIFPFDLFLQYVISKPFMLNNYTDWVLLAIVGRTVNYCWYHPFSIDGGG